MKTRGAIDRGADDMRSGPEAKMAHRFMAALKHPDCPTLMLDLEASRLARFLAVRYCRYGAAIPRVGAYE